MRVRKDAQSFGRQRTSKKGKEMNTILIIKISLLVIAALLGVGGLVWAFKATRPPAKKPHKKGHGDGGHDAHHSHFDPGHWIGVVIIGGFGLIFIWAFWLEWSG